MSERNAELDYARAIAIVLVVFGHALRGLMGAGYVSEDGWAFTTDYLIYTFHMPLFLLISGALFAPEKFVGLGGLLGKLGVLVVWPYLLWSLVQGAAQVTMASSGAVNNADASWIGLLQIGWVPIGQFWFLYALFFAQILAFLAYKRLPVWLTAVFAFFVFTYLGPRASEVPILVAYGCFYFALGMLARKHEIMAKLPSSWSGALALLAAGLLVAIACYMTNIPAYMPIPAAIMLSAATISVCKALAKGLAGSKAGWWMAIVGQCSMGIYVLHILVIGVVRLVMTRFIGVTDPALLLVVLTIMATAIPIAVQLAALRLGVEKWIGMPCSAKPFTASASRGGVATPAN